MLQTLLLLRQSANKEGKVADLHLSGSLYEAGTTDDVLHPASEHQISFELREPDSSNDFRFRAPRIEEHTRVLIDAHPSASLQKNTDNSLPRQLSDKGNGFAYLNAERIGPRVNYALPSDELRLDGLVGMQGEYTAAILGRASSNEELVDGWGEALIKKLSTPSMKLDDLDITQELQETGGRLDLVCNKMLSWILPGNEFFVEEHHEVDSATLRFLRDKTKATVRPTHIGFGLSYTLPIITAALALRQDGLMLVENPEAHLHPYSQSRMGVFLAMMAATGRQIFVETHSDHVINGIRLAVRFGFISPEQVYINYFQPPKNGGNSATVTQITAKENGRLTRWPKGFFDQIASDLSKL